MRQLGHHTKRSAPIGKILFFALIFLGLTIAVLKLLNIDQFIFKGPKTVVELITDTGLESNNGRVNVLLLGIGGVGHEGPDLTDTMIFASIDKKGKDVVLVSLPRDLWAPNIKAKINHAYAYGQEKDSNGLELAKETIQLLFNMPVHYAVRIDFNGFTKAVDLVDGLNIDVEKAFVDPKYPISGKEDDLCDLFMEKEEIDGLMQEVIKDATGSAILLSEITDENDPFTCRYETLTFEKGPTIMDGGTAF